MALAYKNFFATAGTSLADAYTCPPGTQAIVSFLQVANIHASSSADVTVAISDASAGAAEFNIARNITVPVQSAVSLLDGKLILEAGDKLRLQGSAASALTLIGSVTEVS